MTGTTMLDAMHDAGELEAIDVQLGRLVLRRARDMDPDRAELLAASAARLSAARRAGHTCLSLSAIGEPLAAHPDAEPLPSVSVREWEAAFGAAEIASLCGDGSVPTPLVRAGDRVYLYRYWAAERRLGGAMRRMLDGPAAPVSPATAALLGRLFPPPADGSADLQADAARMAITRRFGVITGGPGTGKTTTVARILALLLTDDPHCRIALAAPTGKAAARLRDAVETELRRLDLPASLRDRVPTNGRTLHRLLGYRPWDDRFGYTAARPLTDDVIVVDEASMVDLLLMDALFDAAAPGARIILLGDHGQLASVETGSVLGDFCRLALTPGSPLRASVVELTRSYRFEQHPGIGALAAAIRAGDAAAALDVLQGDVHVEVAMQPYPDAPAALLPLIAGELEAFLAARDPREALERLGAFRVLCGTYAGPWGVDAITAAVERYLSDRGRDTEGQHYDHRPVLVTSNDHPLQLFNGDVGVILESDDGSHRAWFPDGKGGVRQLSPARLPAHATAWAMTVHKAQGSEFDRVVVVLPQADARVLSRELLYTAVTRARARVDVVGDADALVSAAERVTRRHSGLASALAVGASARA